MNLIRLSFIAIFLFSSPSFALKVRGKDSTIINRYSRVFKKFVKKSCRPGYEFKYQKLIRSYRGSGLYYPMLKKKVDLKTIREGLPIVKRKKKWIEKQIDFLSKRKKLTSYSRDIIDLKKIINELLEYKGKVLFDKKNIKKNTLKSKKLLKKLKSEFDNLIKDISFMTNFSYPVDHLKNRREYDNLKGPKNARAANKIFFLRRLVEDGTLDGSGGYPDMFLRTSLDTIKLELDKQQDFLTDGLRYDLEWAFGKIHRVLKHGRKHILARMKKWLVKVDNMIASYEEVLKDKKNKIVSKILSDKDKATSKLISYVYPKQAKTYRFWLRQSELNRALYVLSTILFNEVGDVDPSGLERADVLKIVMNRKKINYYRKLHPRQRLSKMLGRKERNKWLNLLFRRGEFSFTYHFIPSVKKIFCPDMSARGRSLRRENLKIALDILKTYKKGFKATRYYSRHSMVGKIDMSSVWSRYRAEPERPGKAVRSTKRLLKLLRSGKYRYFYHFTDKQGVERHVLEFEGNPFVVTKRDPNLFEFHTYRNPYYFTYFTKI